MSKKKIAVVIRDRQREALRMALGLILIDDLVDVYLLGRMLDGSEEDRQNLELMKDMGIQVYSDAGADPGIEQLSAEQIARRLLEYDHILPY